MAILLCTVETAVCNMVVRWRAFDSTTPCRIRIAQECIDCCPFFGGGCIGGRPVVDGVLFLLST